jgi:hypothetical protein
VPQTGHDYTVRIDLNHEASDAMLTRFEWTVRGGRCPEADERPVDYVYVPFRTVLTETGLRSGSCYRWDAAAIDDNDEVVHVVSEPVTIRDIVRPTIVGRSPRPGAGPLH